MYRSSNERVQFLARYSMNNGCSLISRNIFFITDKYNVSRNDILHGKLNAISDQCSEYQERVIAQVRELLKIRDGQTMLNGFSNNEVQDIIDFISCM